MNKLLALAAAGALALGMVAATAVPSQAAKWQNQNDWQGQQWKKGGQFQKFGNFKNHQFNKYQGGQNIQKYGKNNWQKWDGPKNFGNNWKPPHHGNYPKTPPFKKYVKKYPHHQHFNPAPFIFGFALGTIVSNAYAYDYGLTPHQLWCLQAYPNTYNPATNLFYIKPGVLAVCVSPYSGGPVGYFPY
jgi:hypothetical protein